MSMDFFIMHTIRGIYELILLQYTFMKMFNFQIRTRDAINSLRGIICFEENFEY